jgi:hypothetical protein
VEWGIGGLKHKWRRFMKLLIPQNLTIIMYLVNSKLLKSPKLTIEHLEVGKLKKTIHLGATK